MNTLDRAALEQIQSETLATIHELVVEAEGAARPLELDPARSRLFDLFAKAEAAGCLEPEAEVDLSADELCRLLGERWGLRDAARESVSQQAKIPAEHLVRMRSLWSVMRMWMEWTYAWQRWSDFHTTPRHPR